MQLRTGLLRQFKISGTWRKCYANNRIFIW